MQVWTVGICWTDIMIFVITNMYTMHYAHILIWSIKKCTLFPINNLSIPHTLWLSCFFVSLVVADSTTIIFARHLGWAHVCRRSANYYYSFRSCLWILSTQNILLVDHTRLGMMQPGWLRFFHFRTLSWLPGLWEYVVSDQAWYILTAWASCLVYDAFKWRKK